MEKRSNIVLIGMPGSGKSTVGVILAKMLAKDFVDTDVLIQTREGATLQEIIDRQGHMELRRIEAEVLLGLTGTELVIATGGSAAYSDPAMRHLRTGGITVFLDADLATLRQRITNFDTRGLAKRADQSLEDLFAERLALYRQYADITVESSGLGQEEVCQAIMTRLGGMK